MSEIISSESTILAVITILFTIWQNRIERAMNIEIDKPYADLKTDHEFLLSVKKYSVLPLAMASVLNFLFLIPKALVILKTSFEILFSFPITQVFQLYDLNSAILLFIDASFLLLTILFFDMFIKMADINKKILIIKNKNDN